MSDRENCFSTAIRLLARHDACNDQVTGETLLSLLRLLERNELQHSQDYAALDALTRKLTSLVAHLAEHTIADEDYDVRGTLARVEWQLGALAQPSSTQASNPHAFAAHASGTPAPNGAPLPPGPGARIGRSNTALQDRRKPSGMGSPIIVDDPDERQPVKRSFVDVVADITRRREAHAFDPCERPIPCLDAVRSSSDEYRIETDDEPAVFGPHRSGADRRAADRVAEHGDEDLALEEVLGQLDRITTQLERSERVLSALPELVDTVGDLITEIERTEHGSDGSLAALDAQRELDRAPNRPVPPAADELAVRPAASDRQASDRPMPAAEHLRSEPPVHATDERVRASARAASIAAKPLTDPQPSAVAGQDRRAVRPAALRRGGGAGPRRFLPRINDKLAHRRWRPLAGACALFLAATMAMAFEITNSRMEPAHAVEEAQAAVPTIVAAAGMPRVPSSDLLSHEQITRTPIPLIMPTMVSQHGPSEAQPPLMSAETATAMSPRAIADYQLGMRYVEGRNAPQDMSEAACLFERASIDGFAPAQYRLALLLERGLGTPKNLARAKDLYRRAAEAGHVRAMHNLAVLLSQGSAADAYKDAAVWFERAAQFGVADSQYNLGVLFSRGLGVPRSASQAYRWFGIAAKQGDAGARHERDAIGASLSAADLAAAKLEIAAFVARPATPGVNALAPDDFSAGGARLRKIGISIAEPCAPKPAASLRVSMK